MLETSSLKAIPASLSALLKPSTTAEFVRIVIQRAQSAKRLIRIAQNAAALLTSTITHASILVQRVSSNSTMFATNVITHARVALDRQQTAHHAQTTSCSMKTNALIAAQAESTSSMASAQAAIPPALHAMADWR